MTVATTTPIRILQLQAVVLAVEMKAAKVTKTKAVKIRETKIRETRMMKIREAITTAPVLKAQTVDSDHFQIQMKKTEGETSLKRLKMKQ